MNKKNIFDMLENAEDDSMDELTGNCPEISGEQFEKLLAGSERKYKMKKEEIERTRKDNNISGDEVTVSGVDRVKRPVWLPPLITAASLVLVTGTVLGSVLLLNRNGGINGGGSVTPAATAVATDKNSTETTYTSSVRTTSTQAVTTVSTSVQENTAETNVQSTGVQDAEVTTASTTAADAEFREGTLEGKVYTSDYAGFRFRGSESMDYMSREDRYTEQQMRNRFKSQEEKYIIDSENVDAAATDYEKNARVDFTFINTKSRFPDKTDVTFDDFITKREFDGAEWIEYNVTEPETVELGGKEYTKTRISVDYAPDRVTIVYLRKIDDDFTLKITYSTIADDDGSEFESRFEAID